MSRSFLFSLLPHAKRNWNSQSDHNWTLSQETAQRSWEHLRAPESAWERLRVLLAKLSRENFGSGIVTGESFTAWLLRTSATSHTQDHTSSLLEATPQCNKKISNNIQHDYNMIAYGDTARLFCSFVRTLFGVYCFASEVKSECKLKYSWDARSERFNNWAGQGLEWVQLALCHYVH